MKTEDNKRININMSLLSFCLKACLLKGNRYLIFKNVCYCNSFLNMDTTSAFKKISCMHVRKLFDCDVGVSQRYHP